MPAAIEILTAPTQAAGVGRGAERFARINVESHSIPGPVAPGNYYGYAPGNYYGYAPGYAGLYAYSYGQPGPFGWQSYGYGGGWPPGSAASVLYNIHTPVNH